MYNNRPENLESQKTKGTEPNSTGRQTLKGKLKKDLETALYEGTNFDPDHYISDIIDISEYSVDEVIEEIIEEEVEEEVTYVEHPFEDSLIPDFTRNKTGKTTYSHLSQTPAGPQRVITKKNLSTLEHPLLAKTIKLALDIQEIFQECTYNKEEIEKLIINISKILADYNEENKLTGTLESYTLNQVELVNLPFTVQDNLLPLENNSLFLSIHKTSAYIEFFSNKKEMIFFLSSLQKNLTKRR